MRNQKRLFQSTLVYRPELRIIKITNYEEWFHAPALMKYKYEQHRGVVSRQVITDAGVAALIAGAKTQDFRFHGVGTDDTAEAAGQTALIAASPEAKVFGTDVPVSNTWRTVATIAVTVAQTFKEWGLFNASDVMLDRGTYPDEQLFPGEAITTDYTLTLTAGG